MMWMRIDFTIKRVLTIRGFLRNTYVIKKKNSSITYFFTMNCSIYPPSQKKEYTKVRFCYDVDENRLLLMGRSNQECLTSSYYCCWNEPAKNKPNTFFYCISRWQADIQYKDTFRVINSFVYEFRQYQRGNKVCCKKSILSFIQGRIKAQVLESKVRQAWRNSWEA